MPGAPLLRTTAARPASMLSGAQIASMRWLVDAGLSGSGVAVTASTSCPPERGASHRPVSRKSKSRWYGDLDAVMRRPSELPFPSPPCGDRSGLRPARRPTMPFADFCTAVRGPLGSLSPGGHGADLLG